MATAPKLNLAVNTTSNKLGEKMHELALKEREREVEQQAGELGLPYLNLTGFPIGHNALQLVPEETAKHLNLVPLIVDEREARFATTDPSLGELKTYLEKLSEEHSLHCVLYLVSPHSLELALQRYAGLAKVRPITTGVTITEADLAKYRGLTKDIAKLSQLMNKANVSEMITLLIAGALDLRASDIHVEAEEEGITVRYRIDGTLYIVATIPREHWPKLISRLKLLAKLKLNIANTPQDGRYTIFLKQDQVDVRVSTIPTAYGESVVMRLLRSSATGLNFDDIGLRGKAYDDLKREVERPNGLIMATGPTGSGKTTTLYAILNKLNDSETKIITLEDPIEYKLKGINQSQVEHTEGYGFAEGLRAILRQDPDIVMVGEIRDFETADIAINAALTGHLVISTIHTNSAAGAIPRFLAMGAKSFLLAPALNCVIGQRLVRKICPDCKEELKLGATTLKRVKDVLSGISPQSEYKVNLNKLNFHQGKGCSSCGKLGYKGRIGIYEIMTTTPEIEKLIFANQVTEVELREIAVRNGMITMVQDGLLKALDGITTVDEVFRVAE